jgi:hypothetical protein
MVRVVGLLLGLALGVWQTRRRRQATAQLHGRSSAPAWAFGVALAWRLLPLALLLGLSLTWSPAAALAVLGGYWLGRTAVLVHDLFPTGAGSE